MQECHLLSNFVATRSEAAFCALVKQHIDMVIGVAMRRTGNREMAEEVAQNVFTILARKAHRLKAGTGLAGWLHRTSVFESAKAVRSERRRIRKIEALAVEMKHSPPVNDNRAWNDALSLVDEAIEALPQRDRELILRRFFQGWSFREIAIAAGKTEGTVRKDSSRILEKLSCILKRRGVVIPAAALATSLSTDVSAAVSDTVAKTVSHVAFSSAGQVPSKVLLINSIQTMSYSKMIPVCAAIIVLLAVGTQRFQLDGARSTLADLKSRAELSEGPLDANPLRRHLTRSVRPQVLRDGTDGNLDLVQLAADLDSAKRFSDVVGQMRIQSALELLGKDALVRLLAETESSSLGNQRKALVHFALLDCLLPVDPTVVAQMAFRYANEGYSSNRREFQRKAVNALKLWAAQDPKGSGDWLDSVVEDQLSWARPLVGEPFDARLVAALVAGMGIHNPEEAIARFEELESTAAYHTLTTMAADLSSPERWPLYVAMAQSFGELELRDRALEHIAPAIRKQGGFDEAARFAESIELEGESRAKLALIVARPDASTMNDEDLQPRLDWLREFTPEAYRANNVAELRRSINRWNARRTSEGGNQTAGERMVIEDIDLADGEPAPISDSQP